MIATIFLMTASLSTCAAPENGAATLVDVHGFKDRKGQLRIAVYPATEEAFLASARYVARIDTPMTSAGSMQICVQLPAAGTYAVAALHDRDKSGKFGAFTDGVGFSNNPKLGLSKPKVEKVATTINGVQPLSITLNYVQGFRPAPWRQK